VVFVAYLFFKQPAGTAPTPVPISQVVTMSEANQIKSINVQGQNLTIIGTDGVTYTSYLDSSANIYDVKNLNLNPPVVLTFQAPGIDWVSIIVPTALSSLSAYLSFIMFFRARGANNQAMSSGAATPAYSPVINRR